MKTLAERIMYAALLTHDEIWLRDELHSIAAGVARLEAQREAHLSAIAAHQGRPGRSETVIHEIYGPVDAEEWIGVGMTDKAMRA